MSSMEDRGFAAMSQQGDVVGLSTSSGVGMVLFGVIAVPVLLVGGGLVYMLYKANSEPDDVRPEDGERAFEALASGDEAGAVIETLAVAKNRKTMKTPLGFRVPNLARFMLPEAEQTRAMGSMLSSKGVGR